MPNPIGPRPTITPPFTTGTSTVGGASTTTGVTPTAPTEVTTPATVTGGTIPSGSGTGLVGRLRTKIVERTWKEITAARTVSVGNLDIGDHGNLAIRLKEKLHRANDARITGDANKAATTQKLAAATGKDVMWAETGGLVEPTAALSTSVPISGVVNVSVGFSTRGLLEYRAMHPFAVEGQGALDVLKDHSVDLPVDAAKARALEPGVEIELLGKGSASLSAGVSAGVSHTSGHFSGGLSAGVSASTTRTGTWKVNVARLDGDKVRVQLSEVHERSRAVAVGVHAGITVDGAGLIDDTLGGSVNSATESLDLERITGGNFDLTNDRIADRIKREGAGVVEDAVKTYTAFHASAGTSASESRTGIASYVLDLSTPDGQKAYEKLIRLDEGTAKSLDGRPGVSRHTYNEVSVTTSTHGQATFAGVKLLLVNALQKETEGTLSTSSGTKIIRTSTTERKYNGLITGEKRIKWEGVNVADAGRAPAHFFHLKFTNKDKVTTNDEIKDFVRFADAMGAKDADTRNITLPSSWNIGRIFSSRDNTEVTTDVYFTDAGVRKIASASVDDIRAAVGKAHGAILPERAGAPLSDPTAAALAKEFNRLEKEISREHDQEQKRDLENSQRWVGIDYKKKFARKLSDDAPVFADVALLSENASRMGASGNEEGWSKVFADLGAMKKWEYMPILASLSNLAGADDTLVHEVGIEGEGIHLKSVDEGKLQDPSVLINNGINGHVT